MRCVEDVGADPAGADPAVADATAVNAGAAAGTAAATAAATTGAADGVSTTSTLCTVKGKWRLRRAISILFIPTFEMRSSVDSLCTSTGSFTPCSRSLPSNLRRCPFTSISASASVFAASGTKSPPCKSPPCSLSESESPAITDLSELSPPPAPLEEPEPAPSCERAERSDSTASSSGTSLSLRLDASGWSPASHDLRRSVRLDVSTRWLARRSSPSSSSSAAPPVRRLDAFP
mmetsp:Transcript_106186/g.307290  ORF Transcript_106186/g.307290 Transcript_106186/m.307290 type:complete len:233 (+) Transcript_106186:75-773(+)